MCNAFGHYESLRQMTASLLLVIVLALAFIPTGFMPDFTRGGIQLCSGLTDKIVTLDENGQPVSHKVQAECPFALNGASVPSIQPVTVTAPIFADVADCILAEQIILASIDARAHTSQAPPITL